MDRGSGGTVDAILFDLDQTLLDRGESLELFLDWQRRELLELRYEDYARFSARFVELDANGSVWKDAVYAQLCVEFEFSKVTAPELLLKLTT